MPKTFFLTSLLKNSDVKMKIPRSAVLEKTLNCIKKISELDKQRLIDENYNPITSEFKYKKALKN